MNTNFTSRVRKVIFFFFENIDTFISIILAIVAAILSTFGGRIEIVVAATTSILAILSIGILRDRVSRQQMLKEVQNLHFDIKQLTGHVNADNFFSHKSSEHDIILKAEKEIILIQETGRLIAETNRREIVDFLKKGGRVRWISILDTTSMAEILSFRNANLVTPQLILGRMKSGIEMIEVLASEAHVFSSQLEVRFLRHPTDITAVFKDPHHLDTRKREALIRLQGFRVTFEEKCDFTINADTSKETYSLFVEQMEDMWHFSTKCLFLTGRPAVGKSTLVKKVIDILLQSTDLKIVGFITHDIRDEAGVRIGFETITLDKKQRGILALKNDGIYELNDETMNGIIIPCLLESMKSADIVVIDEIGPIQLQNAEFQKAIISVLQKRSLSIIGTVALKGHPYLSKIHQHYRTTLFEVTETNRDHLTTEVAKEFLPRKR